MYEEEQVTSRGEAQCKLGIYCGLPRSYQLSLKAGAFKPEPVLRKKRNRASYFQRYRRWVSKMLVISDGIAGVDESEEIGMLARGR